MSGLKVSEPPRQCTKKTKKEENPSRGARRESVYSGGLVSLHQCTDLDPLQNCSAHLDCCHPGAAPAGPHPSMSWQGQEPGWKDREEEPKLVTA